MCTSAARDAIYPYPEPGRRERRSAPSGSFDNRVYIDSIGVPRELPDEFWIGIKHLLVITAATRLMGCQDRIALDMLLAEKGGGWMRFGAECCNFLPDNTTPDGAGTRALAENWSR